MAILSVKAAGWLHTAVDAANIGLCGPWRKASNGGAVQKFMAWVADGIANTFTADNLTKITRLTRTDWQGTVALSPTARTNAFPYSSNLSNAYWSKSAATITVGATLGPDGVTNADKIVEDSTNAGHWINHAVPLQNEIYTHSVYLKSGERTWGRVTLHTASLFVNLSNGTLGTVTGGTATIASVGNGWYRVSISMLVPAMDVNALVTTAQSDTVNTYLGDNSSGIYVWGQQLEKGSVPTSYIPTTTDPVSVTDYTLGAGGLITLGEVPVVDAQLKWSGIAIHT